MATYDENGNLIWTDLFREGRDLFYEGKDPDGFVKEMKDKFAFDPSLNNPHWKSSDGYCFFCPASALNAVYGSNNYPLGS